MNAFAEDFDLLMVGAGPSNIALAVAIEELGVPDSSERALMLEAGETIAWHPGMMFREAQSQVSFLKDLVTLRNPTSRFTFLNFLHETGRLEDFINLQTFFPYRREISAYLRWTVEQLRSVQVRLGARVEEIRPEVGAGREVVRWQVRCADGALYTARRLVYGAGRLPNVPSVFRALRDTRVMHACNFLSRIAGFDTAGVRSVAVVGGAQSSAEIYHECLQRFPQARVTLLMRSVGLKPYGGSKFTNDLYSDAFIDRFHRLSAQARSDVLEAMRDSNYAGVTPSMLESLFRIHYLQRFDDVDRARMLTRCEILDASEESDRVRICWLEADGGARHEEAFDLVVLGTGYRNEFPPVLSNALQEAGAPNAAVGRDYRIELPCTPGTSLHVLGVNEATHGISDTLLSVVGARARRVLEDMRASACVCPDPLSTIEAALSV